MIYSSRLLASFRLGLYVLAIVICVPFITLNLVWKSRWMEQVVMRFHRLCGRFFGIKRVIRGEMSTHRPTYFISNHLSYLDIVVLGSEIPASFISKQEIARWPVFGFLAKLQHSLFLDRHRLATASHKRALQERFMAGDNLIMFAEGTTSDGNGVLPFRSSLFAVAETGIAGQELWVQPVTIAYTKLDGIPLGREVRPFIAWYGDMDFLPHFWFFLGLGRLTAEIEFHPVMRLTEHCARKELAEQCYRQVRAAYEMSLHR